jgi:DNA-binding transcriptional LysR family regulator
MNGVAMDRLTAMELFLRIVETGSLSAAAREFDTSQPSVSRQLRALERRLGARLLNRTTRHLTLTEAGRGFYDDCRQIVASVQAAEGSVGMLQASLRGSLKINTSVALGQQFIAPLVQKFWRRHTGLTVDLTLNERFVDLVEEGIDVAVRFGDPQDVNLVARRLGYTRRVIVATPGYLRRHGTPKVPSDLATHNCVLFNYPATPDWTLNGANGEVKVRVTGTFRANNGHVIRGAILDGIGVGWIPEALIHDKISSGAVREILTQYAMQPLDVHALYATTRHLPAKVRAFVDFLKEEFSSIPGFSPA